jgi:hypothetical protein
LGRVQPASDKTALRARHSRDLVVRSRQGREHINGAQRQRGFGAFAFYDVQVPHCVRCDRPAIDARAPPADPAAGRKQRRRMSSVTLPQGSAGVASFGRAVLIVSCVGRGIVTGTRTFPARYKHGRYAAEVIASRRWVRQFTRDVRALTKSLRQPEE